MTIAEIILLVIITLSMIINTITGLIILKALKQIEKKGGQKENDN